MKKKKKGIQIGGFFGGASGDESSANDHIVEEISLLREDFQKLIFGYPQKVLAVTYVVFRCCYYTAFEEEPLHNNHKKTKKEPVKLFSIIWWYLI